jgi:hypothetical protein
MTHIEFLAANSIDRKDPWRIILPLAAIAYVEQHATVDGADRDVARLTLADGRVLWLTETYSSVVERLGSFLDRAA